jgi:hypothetical protein
VATRTRQPEQDRTVTAGEPEQDDQDIG